MVTWPWTNTVKAGEQTTVTSWPDILTLHILVQLFFSFKIFIHSFTHRHCTLYLYTVSQKRPTFDLLWSWHTRSDYDNFWLKCYWESKESDYTLFSHLTYLVLQHYTLQKRKPRRQRTGALCVQRSPTAAALSTFFPLNHDPKSPKTWTRWLQDLGSHTAAWVWLVSQKY